jgi:hypothetical protein
MYLSHERNVADTIVEWYERLLLLHFSAISKPSTNAECELQTVTVSTANTAKLAECEPPPVRPATSLTLHELERSPVRWLLGGR